MFDFSNFNNADIFNKTANNEGMLALFLGTIIFSLILMIILIISYVKALKKSGVSLANILWLFLPIPILGSVMLALKIDPKKYGKGSGYLVGMILLPIIFVPILAFSDNNVEVNVEQQDKANFDAMNVVNKGSEINNLENTPIGESTNNIPIENNSTLDVETTNNVQDVFNLNIEPKIDASTISVAEPTINNVPVQVNDIVNNEPILETTPIMETAPAFNSVPEVTVNESTNIKPVLETFTENQAQSNAFNSVPEIPVSEPVEITTNIESFPQKQIEPIINNELDNVVQVEPIVQEPIKVEEVYVTPIITDNKVCKNCGNTIPEIVSICPNCGTDNE